ncbi:MAG: hypothetical protein Q9221_008414 [Calogaya cf. arnoldii]
MSVEFLAQYYATAIDSTLALSQDPFSFTPEPASTSRTRAAYTPSYTYSSSDTSSSDSGGGLSAGAIRGIAIGISVGVCAIFILLAILIVKRRRANRMKRAAQPSLPPAYSPSASMQQQPPPPSNPAYQPVPQQDQSYSPAQGGYFVPDAVGKNNTSVTAQPSISPAASQTPQQRHSAAPSSFLSPNPSDQGRESFYRGPVSPTITEVDGSDRPMPEADSIQRPTSTHQGMVSPMVTGSPPPPNLIQQSGQQHGHLQQPPQNQGQVRNGYVPPRAGTHEAPLNHANPGPYEMPDERH